MEKLDEYCLYQIFQYLSPKDRLNVNKVCGTQENIINALWRTTQLTVTPKEMYNTLPKNYDRVGCSDLVRILQCCGPILKSVTLRLSWRKLNDSALVFFNGYQFKTSLTVSKVLKILIQFCHNLEDLRVYFSDDFKYYAVDLLNKLINSNRKLRKLIIDGFDTTEMYLDDTIKFEKLPDSLEELILKYIKYKNNSSFYSFLQRAKNLKKLKIIGQHLITNRCLEILSTSLTELKTLHLREKCQTESNISSWSLMGISKLVNLKELIIEGFETVFTDDVLQVITTACKKIRKLALIRCSGLTNESVQQMIRCLEELHLLELIMLDISEIIQDSSKTYPALRILKLTSCRNLSIDAITRTIRMLPYLRFLEIFHCSDQRVCNWTKLIDSTIVSAATRNLNFQISEYFRESNEIREINIFNKSTHSEKGGSFYLHCTQLDGNLQQIIESYVAYMLPASSICFKTIKTETIIVNSESSCNSSNKVTVNALRKVAYVLKDIFCSCKCTILCALTIK